MVPPQIHSKSELFVADPKSGESGQPETWNGREGSGGGSEETMGRQAEQQLGRATNGCASRVDTTASRVDRLRLLGNGVVPATAAKAWTVLSDSLWKLP